MTHVKYSRNREISKNTDYNHVINVMLVCDIVYEDGPVITLDRINDEQHRLIAGNTYEGKIRVLGSESEVQDDISIKSVSETVYRKDNHTTDPCDSVEAF